MSALDVAVFNAVYAVVWTACLYFVLLRHVWPWDLRGRRRTVTLKRGRRDWE